MTKLVWNQEGQNRYEFGVDHGVFYDSNNLGVVWNGLLNVEEASAGGEIESFHFDGLKYLDAVTPRNYQSTLSAYSMPNAFKAAVGEHSIIPGFILTRQSRMVFGLSYRTFVGQDLGYKIHIVYNALATPTKRSRSTIANDISPLEFAWKIDAVPPVRDSYRPSAHYILDSLTMPPDALAALEEILYGSDTTPARLPDPGELENIAILWEPLIIMAQPITGLSELVPGLGDIYKTEIDGIHRALPQTRLVQTPIRGFYRLE